MPFHSSHHHQEVLLALFSLYVHKGGLKPHSLHFYSYDWVHPERCNVSYICAVIFYDFRRLTMSISWVDCELLVTMVTVSCSEQCHSVTSLAIPVSAVSVVLAVCAVTQCHVSHLSWHHLSPPSPSDDDLLLDECINTDLRRGGGGR